MRNRKNYPKTSLAEGEIVLRIPLSYENLDVDGRLGWKIGEMTITSSVNEQNTKKFVIESLKQKGII